MSAEKLLAVGAITALGLLAGRAVGKAGASGKDCPPGFVPVAPNPPGNGPALTPEMVAIAKQIRAQDEKTPFALGTIFVRALSDGRACLFRVEIHGPNEWNPKAHRGVGVRVCVRPAAAELAQAAPPATSEDDGPRVYQMAQFVGGSIAFAIAMKQIGGAL